VHSPALGQTSIFDPTQHPPDCTTDQFGNAQFAASRNQNIYTTRVTDGLFAGSPGNAKPLGKIKRAFTVFVQNARNTSAAYRLTIAQQPSGGSASTCFERATSSSTPRPSSGFIVSAPCAV